MSRTLVGIIGLRPSCAPVQSFQRIRIGNFVRSVKNAQSIAEKRAKVQHLSYMATPTIRLPKPHIGACLCGSGCDFLFLWLRL